MVALGYIPQRRSRLQEVRVRRVCTERGIEIECIILIRTEEGLFVEDVEEVSDELQSHLLG